MGNVIYDDCNKQVGKSILNKIYKTKVELKLCIHFKNEKDNKWLIYELYDDSRTPYKNFLNWYDGNPVGYIMIIIKAGFTFMVTGVKRHSSFENSYFQMDIKPLSNIETMDGNNKRSAIVTYEKLEEGYSIYECIPIYDKRDRPCFIQTNDVDETLYLKNIQKGIPFAISDRFFVCKKDLHWYYREDDEIINNKSLIEEIIP
jgi:hypothetical protein